MRPADANPLVSLVVVVHSMARQAANALYSFSPKLQRGLAAERSETIVVEIESADLLGEAAARETAGNVRYYCLGPSTRAGEALNFGVAQSRAALVGLVLDGAHIVTARTLEHVLAAQRACERPLVIVPAYTLVPNEADSDQQKEQQLLQTIDWRRDPYQMFDVARFGPANPNGFLCPLLGGSCIFAPRASFDAVGGADATLEPAAALNFLLYSELSRLRNTRLLIVASEGAFRQLHPGVMQPRLRHAESSVPNQLQSLLDALGPRLRSAHREPTLFGAIPGPAQRFLVDSFASLGLHHALSRQNGEPPWYVDPA